VNSTKEIKSTLTPNETATHHYQWPWGETGHCTAEEAVTLRQTASNLGREVYIQPIPATQEAPLERSERSSLRGTIYALEEELADVRSRSAALSAELTSLRADARVLVVQSAAHRDSLAALDRQLRESSEAHAATRRELALVLEEREALKATLASQG